MIPVPEGNTNCVVVSLETLFVVDALATDVVPIVEAGVVEIGAGVVFWVVIETVRMVKTIRFPIRLYSNAIDKSRYSIKLSWLQMLPIDAIQMFTVSLPFNCIGK